MDFITEGYYKDYLARMFRFDWKKVLMIMMLAAVLFFIVYLVTEWRHIHLSGLGICILVGIYMGCVAGVTLYNRTPSGTHNINLDLFWSYRAYLTSGSRIRLVEIVCNIIMFIPFGILIPMLFSWTRNFFVFMVYNAAFTVFIESAQYYTTRGLFELDDIFNNALGGMIGFFIFYIIYKFIDVLKPGSQYACEI